MTVSTTVNKIVQLGDGVTLVFSFPFAVRTGGQTDIQVFVTSTTGVITQLTYGTQYTVALNAAVAPNPTPVGGTITCAVAPANLSLVTILRTMALTQPTSLANQGTLYQPVLESMDDNQSMELQQISDLQGRALTVAVSDSAPLNLPPAAQRANLALTFDSSGNPIASAIPATGVISSAMAPFCSAVSIAAAKALLGYGSMANENIGAAGKGIIDDGTGNARVNQTVLAVVASQTPGVQQHMTNYASSGTNTFTLPKLSTVFNGYELWVFCLTNTATLSPNASDNFPSLGGGVSIVLTQGQAARLIGDGVSAWSISVGRIPGIGSSQTRQVFTSGSAATYTTPAGCRRIVARYVGGGGGGGGTSSDTSATNGGNGGNTTFNSVAANGGLGGPASKSGGNTTASGGTGPGTGSASTRIMGGTGQGGQNASASVQSIGGLGGPSVFGGAGFRASPNGLGDAAQVNTGSGGAGGGTNGSASIGTGAGGSAGEYVELIINNPAATYTYTVGGAGTAGGAGTGGVAGGAGAAGLIIVDEYY